MWQSPNQRVRALAAARKRERDRLLQPFHIRRVIGEVEIVASEPVKLPARVVLNDFNAKGTSVFLSQALVSGQEIVLTIQDPKPFTLKGRVLACQEYDNGSHILSKETFPYRITMRFQFESPEQEQKLAEFCKELSSDYLHGTKAA